MSLVVVDTSVVLKWVLNEPGHPEALDLLRQHLEAKVTLTAPDVVMAEAASALAKRTRRGILSPAQAGKAFAYLTDFRIQLEDTAPLVQKGLRLALTDSISLWDALFLVLATELHCPLISADKRFCNAAKPIYEGITLLQPQS